jgi:hypothetical protein
MSPYMRKYNAGVEPIRENCEGNFDPGAQALHCAFGDDAFDAWQRRFSVEARSLPQCLKFLLTSLR